MKRIFKSIGIATVVAAAAVPSALAMHAPDDGYAGTRAPRAVSVKTDGSDVFTRYVANHTVAGYDGYKSSYPQLHQAAQSAATIPYLSHGVGVDATQFGGSGVEQISTRPDDRAGTRVSDTSPIAGGARSGSSFDWADAGIGAGSALGVFLLMGVGVAATRNRKGPLAA